MEYALCLAAVNVRPWHTTNMQVNMRLANKGDTHPVATLHQQRTEKAMQMLQLGHVDSCTDKLQRASRQIPGNTYVKQCATYA
jgi:hypothetical protein